MKKWQKTIYVSREEEDEDESVYLVDDTKEKALLTNEDNTEIAVYQLVKVGTVKTVAKLVFDE